MEHALYRMDSFDDDHDLKILGAIRLAGQVNDKELAHCLINPQVLAILSITGRRAMTIHEINTALEISLATCYKLVDRMTELGLMAHTCMARTSARGRAARYTSSLKRVSFVLSDSRMEATITWKNGQVDIFHRDFVAAEAGSEMVQAGAFEQVSPERA